VFADLPLTLPAIPAPDTRHAYHLYTILVDETKTGISRDAFLDAMTYHNIGVGVHYLSLPEHPYYQKTLGWKPEDYPHAMKIGHQTVSLPLSPTLLEKDINDVIESIKIVLKLS
jgi:dTDP-4-amino-4,6-dideoxygalactose transaminase